MTIRQEFDTLTIPAQNLRVWDVIDGNVISKFVRDASYDHRFPDDGPRCHYVEFYGGTRAYLDHSPHNTLTVRRAAHNV